MKKNKVSSPQGFAEIDWTLCPKMTLVRRRIFKSLMSLSLVLLLAPMSHATTHSKTKKASPSAGGTSGGGFLPQAGGTSGGGFLPQAGGTSGGGFLPQAGGTSGGGGDFDCDAYLRQEVKTVHDWIKDNNAQKSKLNLSTSHNYTTGKPFTYTEYKQNMLSVLERPLNISCSVHKNTNYSPTIEGQEKICVSRIEAGTWFWDCSPEKVEKLTKVPGKLFGQVHHEAAIQIRGLETDNGSQSTYDISIQFSGASFKLAPAIATPQTQHCQNGCQSERLVTNIDGSTTLYDPRVLKGAVSYPISYESNVETVCHYFGYSIAIPNSSARNQNLEQAQKSVYMMIRSNRDIVQLNQDEDYSLHKVSCAGDTYVPMFAVSSITPNADNSVSLKDPRIIAGDDLWPVSVESSPIQTCKLFGFDGVIPDSSVASEQPYSPLKTALVYGRRTSAPDWKIYPEESSVLSILTCTKGEALQVGTSGQKTVYGTPTTVQQQMQWLSSLNLKLVLIPRK